MKIKLSSICHQCLEVEGASQQAFEKIRDENNGNESFLVEFNDENLYKNICYRGHKSYFQLSEEKFELLFDLGALALVNGFAKEAVSTFASSYERFIEFYIKVICISRNVPFESFISNWKKMKVQSERQLGAFYVLQLIENGDNKYSYDEDWVKFRNRVIHQGYIPKSDEAIAYGNYIINNIDLILADLIKKHRESIQKVSLLRMSENNHKIGTDVTIITSKMPTIISSRNLWKSDDGKINLKLALESIIDNAFYKDFYIKDL